MEYKFGEHLLEIGFIDSKTLSQITTLYNAKKDINNNQFNKKMTEILLIFFDSLSDIQKKFICFHLPAKFIKITKLKIKKLIRNIISIRQLKNKLLLMKYLFRWYKNINIFSYNKGNIFDNKFGNKNIFIQQSHKFIKANGLKKKIISRENNNIFNNIREFIDKTNNLNTSNLNAKNEKKENKFKNNFKNNNKTAKKDKNTYSKKNSKNININLNNENINNLNSGQIKESNQEYMKRIIINNNQISDSVNNCTLINHKIKNFDLFKNFLIDSDESNENYISTNINSANRYENNKLNNNEKTPNIKPKISNINGSNFNLFNKPNATQNSKDKKILNLKPRNNNNIYNLIYCNNYNNLNSNNIDLNLFTEKTPFCEREIKTIESTRNSRFSPGIRLYEQGIKKIKNKKLMKTPSPRKIPNHLEKQKTVNYKHLNSLYKNKKRSKTMEKLKNKVEKEEGLTFHPEIIKNNYTERINSNFLERNYSIPRNENNINEYNERINSCYTCKNKNINKKNKEKFVHGIIKRLYKNKKNNDNEDNSFQCEKYILREMKTSSYLKGYKKKI